MVTKEFFGHMIQGEWVLPGGLLARPVTVFIGLLRYWDSGAVWKYMARENGTGGIIRENDKDRYDSNLPPSTALEDSILYAQRIGAESMFVFGRPPIYSIIPGTDNIPYPDHWDRFVTDVVTEARGRIKFYELWNEPEQSGYWSGTPAQLVTQSRVAYRIIKSLQPTAIVLSPSMTELNQEWGIKFTDDYFAAGGGECCDGIAIHHYRPEPEDIIQDSAAINRIRRRYNLMHLPVYCTEWNFVDQNLSLRNAKMAQSLIIQASLGFRLSVFDPETEEAANDYFDPTVGIVAEWLIGSEIGPLEFDQNLRYCLIEKPGQVPMDLSWVPGQFPVLKPFISRPEKRGCNWFKRG